jgi:rhodanese-related sulfurtransferase
MVSSNRLKLFLNVAIVLAVFILGAVLVKRFYSAQSHQYDYKLAPHAKLNIAGIDWAKTDRTVLIAMHKDCRFCSESAPFYRRLASTVAKQGSARLIALLPEGEKGGDAYISELAIPFSESRYVSMASLGIRITPTVVIMDRSGTVTDMWIGKLPPRVESVVMQRLNVIDTRPVTDWLIDEATFRTRLANHESMVLLDVRDRTAFSLKHKDGAKNIPLDELRFRAPNEVTTASTVVLYGDESDTDIAYTFLDTQGFSKIFILGPDQSPQGKQRSGQTQ